MTRKIGNLQSHALSVIVKADRPLVAGEILDAIGRKQTPAASAALSRALRRLAEKGHIRRLGPNVTLSGRGYEYTLLVPNRAIAPLDFVHTRLCAVVRKSTGDNALNRVQAAAAIANAVDAAINAYWSACDDERHAIDPADLGAPESLLDDAHHAALMVQGIAESRSISWAKARQFL